MNGLYKWNMTLQVLPPEFHLYLYGRMSLQPWKKIKIETKEPQPYWKPSALKDGESEEFRLLGCYETGHAVVGWQYASEKPGADGELRFAGYVVTRSHPGQPADLARETDWSKPDRPKIDGTFVKPRRFLAWVATSAARGRLGSSIHWTKIITWTTYWNPPRGWRLHLDWRWAC